MFHFLFEVSQLEARNEKAALTFWLTVLRDAQTMNVCPVLSEVSSPGLLAKLVPFD
jgi:hypothetical protein